MPRYFIKTYGCQMNVGDSDKLASVLEEAGYQDIGELGFGDSDIRGLGKCDIVLVNTCVVRQNAEDRAAGYIKTLKGVKELNPELKIVVAGCFVTEPGRDVRKMFPHVDLFIGPSQPEKLESFLNTLPYSSSPSGRGGQRLSLGGGEGRIMSITKYITIMTGCDNFCSYCIVPYVRGREYSRPMEEILEEIRNIDTNQYREIYLLGQNVNSYKYGFSNLLNTIHSRIAKLPDNRISRIRFMTSHPKDMSDDIINAVAELANVCEFFHLPIQHGSDRILKSMNRGYRVDDYRRIVDRIRAKIPNAAITSDVIVGYPGETEEDFRLTLYNIEQIGFDAVNTTAYSGRPATAASRLPDDVPEKVKQERLQEAMRVVDAIAENKNKKLIGSVQEILVDVSFPSPSKMERGIPERSEGRGEDYSGRTRTNKIVKFKSPGQSRLLGRPVNVKITSAKSWKLEGEIVNG